MKVSQKVNSGNTAETEHIWSVKSQKVDSGNTGKLLPVILHKVNSDNTAKLPSDTSHKVDSDNERLLPVTSHKVDSDITDKLTCTSFNLWYLRYEYASNTTLKKLKAIKFTFDFTFCSICIQSKKIHNSINKKATKVTKKLEQIHSDLYDLLSESTEQFIYNFTF